MQNNSKTIQRKRHSLIKTMNNDRELGLVSKRSLIDFLSWAKNPGEEQSTLGSFRNKTWNYALILELRFSVFTLNSQSIVAIITKKQHWIISFIFRNSLSGLNICIHRLTTTLPRERSYTIGVIRSHGLLVSSCYYFFVQGVLAIISYTAAKKTSWPCCIPRLW